MHRLSVTALETLHTFVTSDWTQPPDTDEVRVVVEPLPGRAVVGIARLREVVWVIVDARKPRARQQLTELVANWPLINDQDEWVRALPEVIDLEGLLEPFATTLGGDGDSPIR